MNSFHKAIITFCLLSGVYLLAGEPSVFEAGDINSPNPYGLTKDEKAILQNKKEIQTVKKRLFRLEDRVRNLSEKVDGLSSVVEGIDAKVNKLSRSIKNLGKSTELEDLRSDLNRSVSIQKENFTTIKKILKELSSMIDHINSDYISKNEFNEEIKKIYALFKQKELSKEPASKIYKQAKKAYRNKEYQKAIELFKISAKKHYRPATSHFYIGESCYYQKNYECAIAHYKKSVSIYPKSSFMPTLLLHTAISLEKIGKKKEAQKFYKNLIKLYPKSKAAKIARTRVK